MFINCLLFLFLLLFSLIVFFINNLYVLLTLFSLFLISSFLFKVRLPIYLPFIVLLFINFGMNYWLGSLEDASLVTLRLVIMFLLVNLMMKKIGMYNLSYVIGHLIRSKSITLILLITFSFIPIMIKELREIKRSLKTKNCPLSFKNILTRPSVFVVTFFSNLFKRVSEMEKVLIAKGIDEQDL